MISTRLKLEVSLKSCMITKFSFSMIPFPILTLVSGCSLTKQIYNLNVSKYSQFSALLCNYSHLIKHLRFLEEHFTQIVTGTQWMLLFVCWLQRVPAVCINSFSKYSAVTITFYGIRLTLSVLGKLLEILTHTEI